MKSVSNTAGKAFLVLCACALVIFLLLPFLETGTPGSAQGGPKARPQIFTANPLATLVDRVAALFGNKRAQARLASAKVSQQNKSQPIGTKDKAAYSAQHNAAAGESGANGLGSEAPAGHRFNYGDASMQDENGDWVLVRQTMPEGAYKGMHEVNAGEDAYDSYIKQERNSKFTPYKPTVKQTVPDSKLAKLFNPLKRFLGIGEVAKPVGESLENTDAAMLASSEGMGSNGNKSGSDFIRGGNMGMDFSASGNTDITPTGSVSMADLFNPEDSAEKSLESLIQSSKDEMSKDELSNLEKTGKDLIRENIEKQRAFLRQQILEDAQNQEPEKLLEQTLFTGCDGTLGPLYARGGLKKDSCSGGALSSHAPAVKKAHEASIQALNKAAGVKLPPFRVVVMLGKTEGMTPPPGMEELLDPTMKKVYEAMLQEQGCDKNECYWVANELMAQDKEGKPHEELRQSIFSSGATFSGDPLGRYPKLSNKILEVFQDQAKASGKDLDPENTDEFLSLQKDLGAKAPFYIPYTKKDLDELNKRNSREEMVVNPKNSFLTYIPTAPNTVSMLENLPYPSLVLYDKTGENLDVNAGLTDIQRGEKIRELMENRIAQLKEFGQDIQRQLTQFGLNESMKKQSAKIQEDAKKSNQEFTKTKKLGTATRTNDNATVAPNSKSTATQKRSAKRAEIKEKMNNRPSWK